MTKLNIENHQELIEKALKTATSIDLITSDNDAQIIIHIPKTVVDDLLPLTNSSPNVALNPHPIAPVDFIAPRLSNKLNHFLKLVKAFNEKK